MATGKFERVIADRGFGFIRVDGGGRAHFTVRDCPDAKEGKRVEFDLQDPEPSQGPHAINLKLLGDGEPAARAPATKKAKLDELTHSFRFGEVTEFDGLIRVPVWITFTRSSEPVPGLIVSLKKIEVTLNQDTKQTEAREQDVLTPSRKAVTDAAGEAYFVLYMLSATTFCDFVAKASSKEFPGSWSLEATSAKTEEFSPETLPQTPAELPVKKNGPDVHGVYTFSISANPGQEVSIHGKKIEVEARTAGSSDPWTNGPFTADSDGRLELEVRGKNTGSLGEVFFKAGNVRSRNRFIERPNLSSGEAHV